MPQDRWLEINTAMAVSPFPTAFEVKYKLTPPSQAECCPTHIFRLIEGV